MFGNGIVAYDRSEDGGCSCRVAIGILTAAGRHLQGAAEIASAVKQSHDNVGCVEFGVNVEIAQDAVGAALVLPPFFFQRLPHRLPVGRIFGVPGDHVGDALMESTLNGDDIQRPSNNLRDVIEQESITVHDRYEDAPVVAVARIHDVPHPVAKPDGTVRHPGVHDPGKISLDLEIDIICVRIVGPMAGRRRHQAIQHIVAPLLIGMPQPVSGMGIGLRKSRGRSIKPLLLQHFNEGEIHVDIVVQTGNVGHPVLHHSVRPDNVHRIGNNASVKAEFRRAAVGNPYGLGSPGPPDLVFQFLAPEQVMRFGTVPAGNDKQQKQ